MLRLPLKVILTPTWHTSDDPIRSAVNFVRAKPLPSVTTLTPATNTLELRIETEGIFNLIFKTVVLCMAFRGFIGCKKTGLAAA